jgi:hypothetical protein
MDPRFLLNLLVGALALLGWAVLIIFFIEFRDEVTAHPIYRVPEGRVNPPQATVESHGIPQPARRKRDDAKLERNRL